MPASERWSTFLDALCSDPFEAVRLFKADASLLELQGINGETPLHYLAVEGHCHAVELLLKLGASPNTENNSGCSALQECVVWCSFYSGLPASFLETVRILLQYKADPYHCSDVMACAWHCATVSAQEQLRALFSHVPPPSEPHERCEFELRLMGLKVMGD